MTGDAFQSWLANESFQVFSVGRAASILGKTKPSDLRDQAEMLAGKAAEIAGNENAEVKENISSQFASLTSFFTVISQSDVVYFPEASSLPNSL